MRDKKKEPTVVSVKKYERLYKTVERVREEREELRQKISLICEWAHKSYGRIKDKGIAPSYVPGYDRLHESVEDVIASVEKSVCKVEDSMDEAEREHHRQIEEAQKENNRLQREIWDLKHKRSDQAHTTLSFLSGLSEGIAVQIESSDFNLHDFVQDRGRTS